MKERKEYSWKQACLIPGSFIYEVLRADSSENTFSSIDSPKNESYARKITTNLAISVASLMGVSAFQSNAINYETIDFREWEKIRTEQQIEQQIRADSTYISDIINRILPQQEARFNEIDTNNDGIVDLTELLCYEINSQATQLEQRTAQTWNHLKPDQYERRMIAINELKNEYECK